MNNINIALTVVLTIAIEELWHALLSADNLAAQCCVSVCPGTPAMYRLTEGHQVHTQPQARP